MVDPITAVVAVALINSAARRSRTALSTRRQSPCFGVLAILRLVRACDFEAVAPRCGRLASVRFAGG